MRQHRRLLVILCGAVLASGVLAFLLLQPPFRVLEVKLWLPDGRLVEVPPTSEEFRGIAEALNEVTPFTRDLFTPAMGTGVRLSEFFPVWVRNGDAVVVEVLIWQRRGTQWGNYHTTRLCIGSTTARLPETTLLIASVYLGWMALPVERDPVEAAAPSLGRAVGRALDRLAPSEWPVVVGPSNVDVVAVHPPLGEGQTFPPGARVLLGMVVQSAANAGGLVLDHLPDFADRPRVRVTLKEPVQFERNGAKSAIRSAILTSSGGEYPRCWVYLEMPESGVREIRELEQGPNAGSVLDEFFARQEWPLFLSSGNGRISRMREGRLERFLLTDEVGRALQHALLALPEYVGQLAVGTQRWSVPMGSAWIRAVDGSGGPGLQRTIPGTGVLPELIDFYYLPPTAEDPREHYRFWAGESLRMLDRRFIVVREWAGEYLALPGVSPAPKPLERLRDALLTMKDAIPLPANAPD